MYIDSALQSSLYTTSQTSNSYDSLSGSDFMLLLIAQLENQDPLNPMSDTDMLAELAQFSSLEQLTTMNQTLQTISDQFSVQTVNSALSFIGLDVVAAGNGISKGADGVSELYYTLPEDAASATANIYDEDGSLVTSVSLTDLTSGEHSFTWDGRDSFGAEAADSKYTVSIEARGQDGDLLTVSTLCKGTVVGLTTSNGSTVFELDDGRTVDIMAVTRVHSPSA